MIQTHTSRNPQTAVAGLAAAMPHMRVLELWFNSDFSFEQFHCDQDKQ